MKILILGGTQFIGRYLVQSLLANGHDLTLFHRGKTNQGLFENVNEVLGDRNDGFSKLGNGPWDCVVDTCAYVPSQTRSAISYFSGKVDHFVFISTRSVYDKTPGRSMTEETIRLEPIFEDVPIEGEAYGRMKVACEDLLDANWKGKLTHIRPGVVIGPHDPTQRFVYWPLRYSMGGNVLVPDVDSERVTGVDVRDLADFIVISIEKKLEGAYNIDNADMTIGDVIRESSKVAPGGVLTIKVPVELLKTVAQPWVDLPIWSDGAFADADPTKAVSAGLTYRPLSDTVQATMDWAESAGLKLPLKAGWDLEREDEARRQLGL